MLRVQDRGVCFEPARAAEPETSAADEKDCAFAKTRSTMQDTLPCNL